MKKQHWQDWLIAAVGVWLIISNWVLPMGVPESALAGATIIYWNSMLTGILAAVLGFSALASFSIWEEWADLALGVWLVASPWLLAFSNVQMAMWNVVACGVIVILSAAWTLYDEREARLV